MWKKMKQLAWKKHYRGYQQIGLREEGNAAKQVGRLDTWRAGVGNLHT
jgi:hypothetical protein